VVVSRQQGLSWSAPRVTPDEDKLAERTLAAAEVLYESGAFDAVENLLDGLGHMRLDELQEARTERLRAQVSLSARGYDTDALLSLIAAADRLERLEPKLAKAALMEAVTDSFFVPNPEIHSSLADAVNRSPAPESSAVMELMLRGLPRRGAVRSRTRSGKALLQRSPAGDVLVGSRRARRGRVALR
jgi:hypothetical protein